MNSLTSGAVSSVLQRLFREAEITDRPLIDDFLRNATKDPWTKLLEEEAKGLPRLVSQVCEQLPERRSRFWPLSLHVCPGLLG
jgi:hypothetical protein